MIQRNHQNYVENISLSTLSVLAGGLACPHLGVGLGLTHILGRFLFSFFVKQKGGAKNKGRILGVVLTHLANLAGLCFFVKKYFFS